MSGQRGRQFRETILNRFVPFLGRDAVKDPSESFGVREATTRFPPVITDENDTLRFGPNALNANEYNGRVNVNR
ncbi:hypothetical protein HYT45_01655 [Candidatus Uhrbacteria bacterium]|nr:hypothetical protein [Candidatus Uhrbacteria bacterium]